MTNFWGPTTLSCSSIVGVGGQPYQAQQTPPLNCIFKGIPLTHSFLVIPTCPIPLLGRDLLAKVGASISFAPPIRLASGLPAVPLLLLLQTTQSNTLLPLPSSQVYPQVWDTQNPSIAKHHTPLIIRLQNPAKYITKAQYPLSLQSLRGLKPLISDLLRKSLLCPTSSPFNTPILAVKKPNGTYRLVQDLRLINSAVVPLHPVVPNPYTLLSTIPSKTSHFSVLDLKDAFFSIPLDPQSQNIFAFTWTDPDTHISTQLTWTVLPQGFRDSPHLFGQALASDLFSLSLPKSKLIQYVDDLLLCSPSLEISQADTSTLLNFLCSRGYRVSPSKVQLSIPQVTYLGLTITPTHKAITLDRKNLIQSLTVPTTKDEILSFLGMASFLRSWIPSFSLLARPLYQAALGPSHEPLLAPVTKPFRQLQQALLQAPALHLPDLTRPFSLYVTEKEGYALGVLGHQLGPSFAPVAYLSKKLDHTIQGWAPCLRALAAAELLIRESKKLTFGSPTTVLSPHHLSHLLTYKGLQTLPPSRVLSLQVALVEDTTLTFQPCPPLNISNLLPQPVSKYSPSHSYIETLEELLPHPTHIHEGALPQATYTWYTDGSSFLNLSYHLLFQTLISTYKLLNNVLPNRFEECWLCVPPGSNSQPPFVASPIVLTDFPTLPLLNCSEPNITTTPYLSHISLFGISDCFSSAGTHLVGILDSKDCNNTITLNTTTQPLCPNIHNASILCGTQVYHCLPASWSGTCTLVFLFPKLGVIPGEEPLPIPITKFIAGRHDKRAIQIIPLLAALGITAGVATGTAGLTISLTMYHRLSSQFIQDFQQVAQTILTLQGQIDSLSAVVLQNRRGLDLLTAERGGLCLFLGEECCFYVNQSGIVKDKIQQLQTDLQKYKEQLDSSGQWITNNPIWNWMLPFLTPLLSVFLILLVAPCLINFLSRFLQQQVQKISNQTFNQLLLQGYQPLAKEPESYNTWTHLDKDEDCPMNLDAPIQQEVV